VKDKVLAVWSDIDSNEFVVEGATRRTSCGNSTSGSPGELDLLSDKSYTRFGGRFCNHRSLGLKMELAEPSEP